MVFLGLDTSCDDTSVALLRDNAVLSNIVSSQVDIHNRFGGVVPEIASRQHLELIDIIYQDALKEASLRPEDLDVVCATVGPGLIGSVLVGLCFAKGLALSLGKPLVAVNHVEAHAKSVFLERQVNIPYVALVVSGGHTTILLVEDDCSYKMVGSTRDDAAGEAFDKISKYLGIGYPGGPIIEKIAGNGNRDRIHFPRPMIDDNSYDFSFSGLKTAFLTYAKKNKITDETLPDVLASFQEAICDVLSAKTLKAARDLGVASVVVGGGVAANGRLRDMFMEKGGSTSIDVFFSSPQFCTDNGAMVAVVGRQYFERGVSSGLDTKAFSRITLK